MPALTTEGSVAQKSQNTTHHIKKKYLSTSSYQNMGDSLLYRPGQGSTLGPFLLFQCFILIVVSFKPTYTPIDSQVSRWLDNFTHLGDSFVDNTGLGCMADTPTAIV